MTIPVSASLAEFAALNTKFRLNIASADHEYYLDLSYQYLLTLPWCDDAVLNPLTVNDAQAFLIAEIAGGRLTFQRTEAGKELTEKSIGRGALVKRWTVTNAEANQSTEPIDVLKTMPLVYGRLREFLCPDAGCSALWVS